MKAVFNFKIIQGDVSEVVAGIPDAAFDAVFSDPPYGISFLGREWDHGVPSAAVWADVMRVLKPGGHLAAFGSPRTYHRLAVNIEDAGFEIRDQLCWLYSQGFPKGHDISKALDKVAGAEREPDGGKWAAKCSYLARGVPCEGHGEEHAQSGATIHKPATAPATDAAKRFEGYKTALKPAYEPLALAMRPLDGTNAHNALKHGVAGLNIDGSRIDTDYGWTRDNKASTEDHLYMNSPPISKKSNDAGRYPANLICDEAIRDDLHPKAHSSTDEFYFYCAKASRAEREAGLDAFKADSPAFGDEGGTFKGLSNSKSKRVNTHPCVKPIDLCRYFSTLLLPPKRETPRRILVPFSGSGSEVIGALLAGWDEVVGIEIDADYVEMSRARISHWIATGLQETLF